MLVRCVKDLKIQISLRQKKNGNADLTLAPFMVDNKEKQCFSLLQYASCCKNKKIIKTQTREYINTLDKPL